MDTDIMNNLYVIIVTFNGDKWIDKCIKSIYESTIHVTVVVVDNNSNDNTIQYVKENFPDVKLFETGKNLGFGKANNIGIRYALDNDADYIYLLNQDAWIERDTFEILISNHKENPEYGILSPMQLNAQMNKFDEYFAILSLGKNKDNILSDLYLNRYRNIYEVDFVMAAHWLISKECIQKVGGFSPVFPHYGEDNDYIHRVHYHKYKIGICPHSKAVHDREFRQRKPEAKYYLKYVSAFLVDLNNINDSFIKSILKAYLNLFKDEIMYAIKYKSLKPFTYIWKAIFVIYSCHRNRNISKKGGLVFLESSNI